MVLTFNKIVNKLWKMSGKIILLSDIEEIIDPENARWKEGKREVYKTIYRLKAAWVIRPLRNGIFYINPIETQNLGSKNLPPKDSEIIGINYWNIVHAYIRKEVHGEAIIAGGKWLELHLMDLSIPNHLIVYTKDVQKNITITDGIQLYFRTIEKWEKSGSIFTALKSKFSLKVDISEKISLRILTHEAAILDALLIHRGAKAIDEYLIKKFLNRYHRDLDRDVLGKLVKIRYISSVNRLREIAKNLEYNDLYEKCLSVIKNEWAGCFLTFKL